MITRRVLLDLLSCDCSMFQLSDPLHPVCVGITLSEMSLQVKPGSRTRTPLHMHALNFIAVLCFRPLMKTGKRASWMKLPRSFIRWWSVSQPINCAFTLHSLLVLFNVCLLNISLFKKKILSFYLTTNIYIYWLFFPKSCSFLFFVWFFPVFFFLLFVIVLVMLSCGGRTLSLLLVFAAGLSWVSLCLLERQQPHVL